MMTKMGQAVLKRNSDRMDELRRELLDLAKRLKSINPKSRDSEAEYKIVMSDAHFLTAELARLQEEINEVIGLERWLPRPKSMTWNEESGKGRV
jgi:seryl-tRNA synthetase